MIYTPENNIKLDDKQTQAIEETKIRLLNLEGEISIGNKNLKVIKAETERAIKEKTYQEGLLAAVETKLTLLRESLADLEEKVSGKRKELSDLLAEIEKSTSETELKKIELKEREDAVLSDEIKLTEKDSKLTKIAFALESEKKEFDKKVARLKETLATF